MTPRDNLVSTVTATQSDEPAWDQRHRSAERKRC